MFEQYNLTSLDTESLENDKIKRYTTERERSIVLAAQPWKLKKNLNFIKPLKMNTLQGVSIVCSNFFFAPISLIIKNTFCKT